MPGFTPEAIERLFAYHQPKSDQPHRYHRINEAAKAFALEVLDCTPPSAEQTIAIRKIQESRMMANASIAINEE